MILNQDSRFAVHLTRLDNFKPVSAGRCDVTLTYLDGRKESFSASAPSRAGIFGVTVKPTQPGEVSIEVSLTSAGLVDAHRIQRATVFATPGEAPKGEAEPAEETLKFLKEQQWALDFGTQLAQSTMLQESLLVPAEVTPRSGGEAVVSTPVPGRLAGNDLPVIGTRVSQGQVLATVIPPTSVPNDRAALDLAQDEADASLDYARRDRARAARLVDAGAAPAKRLDEASVAERIAEARVRAAQERLRQFDATRLSEGAGGSAPFSIRAPIAGLITEMSASPGANLKGGETLFRIIDTARVYVSAIVPEADYPSVRALAGAEIEIPGLSRPRPLTRLISVGKVVDPASRTFPVVYEAANSDGSIAINQTVTIRLFLSRPSKATTVPESALIDDGGRPIVFIQRDGESFMRKPVQVGRRQNGLVEVTSGLLPGDRVVTTGGYFVRLSSLSAQIPAHGHVH